MNTHTMFEDFLIINVAYYARYKLYELGFSALS